MLQRLPTVADDMAALEDAPSDSLIRMFAYALSPGSRAVPVDQLAEAWGILFSRSYLSAEDLIQDMTGPAPHALSDETIRMLGEFVRTDCGHGGAFALETVRQGGNIDRAALIMIGDSQDLARVGFQGSTLLHLLADACEKHTRPALIRKAGKTLAGTYDGRGIPVLITILSLSDIGKEDLIAIQDVFTENEMTEVRNMNGTGNSAWQIFTAVSGRLCHNPQQERNKFIVAPAIHDTKLEEGLKKPSKKYDVFRDYTDNKGMEIADDTMPQKYAELLQNPADAVEIFRRQVRQKK